MFFPPHAAPMALAGKASTTPSSVYLDNLNAGSKSVHPVVIVSGHQTGLNGRYAGLPGWAWLLISIASAIAVLFIGALIYHLISERRQSRLQNRKASVGHAVWKAAKIAFFLWVFTGLVKCITGRKSRTKSSATTYRQVIDDKSERPNDTNAQHETGLPSMSNLLNLSNLSSVSITGGPTYHAYGEGGSAFHASSSLSTSEKYEPYRGAAASAGVDMTAGGSATESRSGTPPYSPNSAFKHLAGPTAYNPTTTISSSMPLMADAHLSASGRYSRPSTRDPSPAPSATYVPSQDSHDLY